MIMLVYQADTGHLSHANWLYHNGGLDKGFDSSTHIQITHIVSFR
jgi:hypothetical protein